MLTLLAQSATEVLDEVVQLFDQAVSARESKAAHKMRDYLAEPAKSGENPLDGSYGYLRQFTPQVLEAVRFGSGTAAADLLEAVEILQELNATGARKVPEDVPTGFVRPAGAATWTPRRRRTVSPPTGITGSCACCWRCGTGCVPGMCSCPARGATPTQPPTCSPRTSGPISHATASLLVGKLSASGRQNALAAALKEYGALRRTIYAARYLADPAYRRKISRQLNKGESLHALKRDLLYAHEAPSEHGTWSSRPNKPGASRS